jgi:hypothetical protein
MIDKFERSANELRYPYVLHLNYHDDGLYVADFLDWLNHYLPNGDIYYEDAGTGIRQLAKDGTGRTIDPYYDLRFRTEDDVILFKLTFEK